MSLLSLQNVTAHYGKSQALFDVSFDLAEGEVLALLGRNGMGKSTCVKAICRMVTASGSLTFDGRNILRLPSHKVALAGIGLVPEGRRCFRGLTVTENLIAAARAGHWDQERVEALFPRLAERRDQVASSLSGGEQQMLAIGRALMTNPRLMILDEATEGLAPLLRQEIWEALTLLKNDTGLSLLVIDKSIDELGLIADRAVILERGADVWTGAFDMLSPEITNRHLGI